MRGNFDDNPESGQILIGQSDETYVPKTMSGDATIDADGVVTVSGGGGGVTQLLAGTNINLSPAGGTGVVTVNATGGGSSLPALVNRGLATGNNVPTLSVTLNVPAGSTIVVSMEGGLAGGDIATDNQGNVYTDGPITGNPGISLHASVATHSGSTTITATFGSTPAGQCSMIVGIFSGVTSIQSITAGTASGPTTGRALLVASSASGGVQPVGGGMLNGFAANLYGYDSTFNNFGHHYSMYTVEPVADPNNLTFVLPGISGFSQAQAVLNY
jgi:hypothetical protein